jgi:prepilin-type N-terminal cleavage/methylation domain-containing protein
MRTASPTPPARASARREAARRAFTVVELMVVVVIILVLASLTLSGLAVARQRVRIARTKSTIRKLHEIVVPHYESYLRRRVRLQDVENPFKAQCPSCYAPSDADGQPSRLGRVNAWKALGSKRQSLMFEMPDSWGDVGTAPAAWQTGPVRAYAAVKTSARAAANGNAECLYLTVAHGGIEPDVMEQFRSDEIGDVDRDQCPEFLDGWGQPIIFLRWAPGFSSPLSPVQVANATTHHDPFDPQRVDAAGYALVPLIVSGGPGRTIGLWFELSAGWQQWQIAPGLQSVVGLSTPVLGSVASASAAADNITNHDLNVK